MVSNTISYAFAKRPTSDRYTDAVRSFPVEVSDDLTVTIKKLVEETDYGTFMSMINDKNIGKVEVEDNQIVFTDKNNEKIYKTGLMNDPALTDRLYECGATFTKDIDQQASPILSFLVTGLLPLIIFIVLGNYMAKKLMEQAGGKKLHGIWQ